MDVNEVMARLEALGNPQTKRIHQNHGAPEPFFGVKVGDLKPLVRKNKNDQALAEALFATGNGDAMYLAGLIADPQVITPEELERWAQASRWYMVSEYAMAGVAAESPHGWELGLRWIEDEAPHVQCTGWATLSGVVALRADGELDLAAIRGLLERVEKDLQQAPNRVRYTMNGFVIAVGCYVEALSALARQVGVAVGTVKVDMGKTACKVPAAPAYIDKVVKAGRLGRKRKVIRC